MKRLSLFILIVFASISLSAKTGLRVDKVFEGKYERDPEVSMTFMSGDNNFLGKNGITALQFFKGPSSKYASLIVPLLTADGANAVGRKVSYERGKLHYAFYSLPPKVVNKKKINRYLCYLDGPRKSRGSVMLLYMEGEITTEKANKLFKEF